VQGCAELLSGSRIATSKAGLKELSPPFFPSLAGVVPKMITKFCWSQDVTSTCASRFPTIFNLVGGIPTPLKNHGVKVSWDSSSQSIQSHNPAMFQSPPTRLYTIIPYNYGKSPFLNGKSPFLMGFPCSSHHQPMKSP